MLVLGEFAREVAKAVLIATLSAVGVQAVQWAFEEIKRDGSEERTESEEDGE